MKNKYRVDIFQDKIYIVVSYIEEEEIELSTTVFQGALPECEAYLSLKEKGYM